MTAAINFQQISVILRLWQASQRGDTAAVVKLRDKALAYGVQPNVIERVLGTNSDVVAVDLDSATKWFVISTPPYEAPHEGGSVKEFDTREEALDYMGEPNEYQDLIEGRWAL